jgi:hypothetical protein
MRLWLLPFRLAGLALLALLLSGAWLFRADLLGFIRRRVPHAREAMDRRGAGSRESPPGQPGSPAPGALEAARDKVDSMHGWAADSVVLSPREMASLLVAGLPQEARRRLDSVVIALADDRVTISGRLETTHIPREALGLLAGALEPWEPVRGSGAVVATGPGRAEWRVDALTLRGFTLPAEASRVLVTRALPGVKDGAIPFSLPRGIARLRVRASGVTMYREDR